MIFKTFIFALAALASAGAFAQEPKTRVRATASVVEVDAIYLAQDNCHRIINATPGAPEGQTVAPQALAITVRVAKEPGACEPKPTPLASSFALPAKDGKAENVQLFYIDREGRVIFTEQVAVTR